MAGTATPIYPQTLKNWYAQLLPATGAYALPTAAQTTVTALAALVAGSTNGDKIESIVVTSTDSATQSLVLAIVTATNTFILGVVSIPATAGTVATIVSVDVLRSTQLPGLAYDANGNKYLYLPSGSTLYVGTLAAVTAAKTIDVIAQGGSF